MHMKRIDADLIRIDPFHSFGPLPCISFHPIVPILFPSFAFVERLTYTSAGLLPGGEFFL
jgi:hypothetical protein